jgi:hypothetical protein
MVFSPGLLVSVDFPGVTGTKRRPAVVLSSDTYQAIRPDRLMLQKPKCRSNLSLRWRLPHFWT